MVIVRESPRARISPSKSQAQWPPASPFQALISSPSGRKKWQDLREQTRERSASPSSRARHHNMMDQDTVLSEDDTFDGEDEESLRLKLEILETKQRLRDLTRKKRTQDELASRSPQSKEDRQSAWSPSKRRKLSTIDGHSSRPAIQVPVSPTKTQISSVPPVSPARVRLGIENSRAEAVSLKRPTTGAALDKVKTIIHTDALRDEKPVSSFSQRLAKARETTQDKNDKSQRLDSIRSKTFAQMQTKQDIPAATFRMPRSVASPVRSVQPSKARNSGASTAYSTTADKPKKGTTNSKDQAFYDPFSELHLSDRNITHTEVAQSLSGCEIYTIPRLLKEIKSPDYEPPECESDYVVFGVLAEKTSPFVQRDTSKVHDRNQKEDDTRMAKNKFMVLRICDLKWELDCYLFGTGFEQYWKLTEGTLLAILNPAIMPPKANQHNGRFSLKIASSEDRILEIGHARDLGRCVSIKKNGSECNSWVDKRKSEYCEFHVNLQVGKARKGRMEVNSMWRGSDPDPKPPAKRAPNVTNHPEYGQLWSFGGGHGRSAAKLLDDDDNSRVSEDLSRKRIAAAERERQLAKKLGAMDGGVAGDYFRAKYGSETPTASTVVEPMFVKPKAAELGLLSRKADQQRLSPAKDRRRHFGIGAISSAGTEAMGWGGARKSGLLKSRETRLGSPERGQSTLDGDRARNAQQLPSRARSVSPQKKTRFMLDKGVKVPGRESGGPEVLGAKKNMTYDNDEDDLDIV